VTSLKCAPSVVESGWKDDPGHDPDGVDGAMACVFMASLVVALGI
jgi:hypothetical protein